MPAQRFADLILDIGTYLLASGAHCGRLNSNIGRLAVTWGFDVHLSPTFSGLLVTVVDKENLNNTVTCYKSSPSHNVHLTVLTEVSHLSWKVQDENLPIEYVERQFSAIKDKKSYNNLTIAVAVGLSCAGLCLFSGGDLVNAGITFIAAFFGFLLRSFLTKKNFNPMLCISMAAFTTTLISGLGWLHNVGSHPEAAMATAVLYLIPGVPLINCVIDLIEGYLSSAINRALFGGFILLSIAAGMTLCITLMGIGNF
ncbi:threonine/serine exporter family protein [Dysgonomonas sp. 511]|uniref:threonine/serine ThrE exporter family protein n=1 Tax=Dysgonomonas sp. 511 TaxID=2302930 RepID=UPI0013D1F905|nr:threonine/serine exporter [Dysgonomonas sp. 511]